MTDLLQFIAMVIRHGDATNDFTRPKLAFYDMGQLVSDIYVVW